jgi:hypothetical protein
MTIKEFSHKHSLVFFWATIVLALLFVVTAAGRRDDYRYGHMMRNGNDYGGQRMRMMNPNVNYNATVPVGSAPIDGVPVEAQ